MKVEFNAFSTSGLQVSQLYAAVVITPDKARVLLHVMKKCPDGLVVPVIVDVY
jgi:hypothetical protein